MRATWIIAVAFITVACANRSSREPQPTRVEITQPKKRGTTEGHAVKLPENGRHLLAWTHRQEPGDLRSELLETAWLHEDPEGTWRKLAVRREPVMATPDGNVWAVRHACWDDKGNRQDDCRLMQHRREPGHAAEGVAQLDLVRGRNRTMEVAPRDERIPKSARVAVDKVQGLTIDDVVRPYDRKGISTIGPYVLWGQGYRFSGVTNPEPVLHVQNVNTGAWVKVLEQGEWATLLSDDAEARMNRFRSHDVMKDGRARLHENEETRFERLEIVFRDDGRVGAKAIYIATYCCRRSCSIGPLEPFVQEVAFDLRHVPKLWTKWAKMPTAVREYFVQFYDSERRGWSEVAARGEDLQAAYDAFMRE